MVEFFDRNEMVIMLVVGVAGLIVVALDLFVWRAVI